MPRKSWWARLPFGVRMSIGGSVALAVVAAGVAGVATMFTEQPPGVQSMARDRAAAPTADAAPVDTSPAKALPPRVPPTADSGLGTLTGQQADAPDRQADVPGPQGDAPGRQAAAPGWEGEAPGQTAAGSQGETPDQILAGDAVGKTLAGPADEPGDAARIPDAASRTVVRQPRPRPQLKPHVSPGAVGVLSAADEPAQPATPAITRRTVSETKPIGFTTRRVQDWSLPPGARQVQTPGVAGERTVRFRVTYQGGKETGRRLLDATVTREPQERVIAFRPWRGADDADQDRGWHEDRDPGVDQPPDCFWSDGQFDDGWDGEDFCG